MFSMDTVLTDLDPQHIPPPWQRSLLKWLFREKEFHRLAGANRHLRGLDMVEQILEEFAVRCELTERDLEQIPSAGPVVVIANHPIGTLDGLALLHAVAAVRGDVKVVANRLLSRVESLSSLMIPVDNMGHRTRRSQVAMMQDHLENQGVLIVFPAGEVSRLTTKGVRDGHTQANDLAERFRRHVYRIGLGKAGLFVTESAIARAEDRAVLKRALAASETLGRTPDGKIIYLYRRQGEEYVPILRELGRLREIAFRAVGEGSGRRRDLDEFDDKYYQLVLWDPQELEIVGAYRFIPTARRLTSDNSAAIYSQTLFHYEHQMDDILAQGIELGRSFIQPAYWGKRGLDYLWLGIGAYLAKYPQYRYLFGPVSISGGLPPAARDILIAFYRLYFAPALPQATSRRPYPASLPEVLAQFTGKDYQQDLQILKRLLSNLGCSIPPLYKQYSELCEPGGVQFIDFGSDPAFNHCIDGLVLVDLTQLKPARYKRYIAVHHAADSDTAA